MLPASTLMLPFFWYSAESACATFCISTTAAACAVALAVEASCATEALNPQRVSPLS